MKRNSIETTIHELNSGEAVHLGHSAVIGNFGGIRVGFDLASIDGYVLAPFANLTLASNTIIPHLIPLIDKQSLPRPQIIAKDLDILIYSHLHPDHFSLPFIMAIRAINPNVKIICPPNTKNYLLPFPFNRKSNLISRIFLKILQDYQLKGIDDYLKELAENPLQREETIQSFIELPPSENLVIHHSKSKLQISSFQVVHPTYQFYFRMPFEVSPPPSSLGYKISYEENEKKSCAIFIGEAATNLNTIAKIFDERDCLSVIFYPIIEQIDPKGLKVIEEFTAHSSSRALALIERIVREGTKIVPLHQGLWYFRVSTTHITNARIALQKISRGPRKGSPFIAITKEFQAINNLKHQEQTWNYITNVLLARKRWAKFKRLAKAAGSMQISGIIDGLSVGKILKFGDSVIESNNIPSLSKETVNSALQAHLAEYQWLRQDVDDGFEWQKTLIQYTLFIIGTVVTIVNVFPSQELLLLVASFMLTLLGWAYIEQSNRMLLIGRYLTTSFIPKVNELLLESENFDSHLPIAKKLKVMNWESFFRGGSVQTFFVGVAAMGKFSYAVLPGAAFAIAFYILKTSSQANWSPEERIAFIVAIIFSSFPVITGILNARFAFTGK